MVRLANYLSGLTPTNILPQYNNEKPQIRNILHTKYSIGTSQNCQGYQEQGSQMNSHSQYEPNKIWWVNVYSEWDPGTI